MTDTESTSSDTKATHLDAETIAQLKGMLEDERAEILSEGAGAEDHEADLADDPGLRLSEREEVEAISALQHAQLAQVDAALERIGSGTYGVCQDCGVAIPVERLEAMPAAAYCVDCQVRHNG
jgi:RNA polymerase-binding transcription factor DksA